MYLLFDIGIPKLRVWVYHHVVYILDLSMTLTFDICVGGGGILSDFYSQFLIYLMHVPAPVVFMERRYCFMWL